MTGVHLLGAALALATAAQDQSAAGSGEPACVDFTAFEFDFFGHGAVLATPVYEREDMRADMAVFEDGSTAVMSAGFCTHPFYQLDASFPVDAANAAALRERVRGMIAIVEDVAGCPYDFPSGEDALEAAVQGLIAEGDYEPDGGAPFQMNDEAGWFMEVTVADGFALATLQCEIHGAGD